MKIKVKVFLRNFAVKLVVLIFILIFGLLYLAPSIFVKIGPGQAGVLYRLIGKNRGTDLEQIYTEGLQIIRPWDKMYVYDVRVQEMRQTVHVLSQNGLTIEVYLSIRYHLYYGNVNALHQKVGPEYERKVIVPSVISSVREIVGKYRPEELYTTARFVIQDEILVEAVESTGRVPIIYDAIIIKNIKLPALINNSIETKLRQQQQYLEYEFRIQRAKAEKERKKIEAEGIQRYQNIVATSLSEQLLVWKGIQATLDLARSSNTKVIIVGSGKNGLPVILNAESPFITKDVTDKTETVIRSSETGEKLPHLDITSGLMAPQE